MPKTTQQDTTQHGAQANTKATTTQATRNLNGEAKTIKAVGHETNGEVNTIMRRDMKRMERRTRSCGGT